MTKKLKIAFQGEPGANSHIAIVEAYPDAEPLPCATFEDALSAISSGEADLGMIPIENSVAGRVADIHHLLPAFRPVHRRRMVPADPPSTDGGRAAPNSPTSRRSRATSTRSASAAASSASSASSRSSRPTPPAARATSPNARTRRVAAIASRLAAQIYGLDILAEDVEDEAHNTTRFVVLAREAKWAEQGSGPLVTTFVFRVRNLPAALYKALGGFATNGVNMTKLESYMVDGEFSATQFYADVDGHPEDKGLAFALEELKFFSREFRIVGVYPGHPFRATFSETQD